MDSDICIRTAAHPAIPMKIVQRLPTSKSGSARRFDPTGGEEVIMYAAIRQGKAKAGMAEELARTIKEGAIPIISDVPGFKAYYVIYAPDGSLLSSWPARDAADDQIG